MFCGPREALQDGHSKQLGGHVCWLMLTNAGRRCDASDASSCIAVYCHVAELAISEDVSENMFDIYALACIASVRVWTFL